MGVRSYNLLLYGHDHLAGPYDWGKNSNTDALGGKQERQTIHVISELNLKVVKK